MAARAGGAAARPRALRRFAPRPAARRRAGTGIGGVLRRVRARAPARRLGADLDLRPSGLFRLASLTRAHRAAPGVRHGGDADPGAATGSGYWRRAPRAQRDRTPRRRAAS